MPYQVFKWSADPLEGPGAKIVRMPKDAEFLAAQPQRLHLALWFRVNPANEMEDRLFYLLETGKDWPPNYRYLATIQSADGRYVFHLLEPSPGG